MDDIHFKALSYIYMNRKLRRDITEFLRKYLKPFSLHEISLILDALGQSFDKETIKDFLDMNDCVFCLENNLYITRAGAFTGMFFSFEPTQQELDQELFTPGDRCMPFVDDEMYVSSLKFEYNGKYLPKKIFNTDCNLARELFTFYGDEYVSQYVGTDPANENEEIGGATYELPPKLKLTGFSLKKIISDTGFRKGDRLLCRVRDWDKGIIEVFPQINHNKNLFIICGENSDRQRWNSLLEKALLDCFDKMGPCKTIEQQLSYAFYDNRSRLCNSDCGSIHEFLKSSTKVAMELYGVETRLWRKGENVPVVGKWNNGAFSGDGEEDCTPFITPEFVIDCLIKDQLFEKVDDVNLIIQKAVHNSMMLSEEEEKFLTLQIMSRNAILRKHYNWFADFAWGDIRHKALGLYSRVEELVLEVDGVGSQLEQFPQQELAVLAQLYSHISRILELLASGAECEDEEKNALKMSLEGMEYSFDDIRGQLRIAIDQYQAGRFRVL